jgi:cytochrome P450
MKRRDIFGEDANLFRPERWLDGDPETMKSYNRAWEITFSVGRFSCLGNSIALTEVTKVLFELCLIGFQLENDAFEPTAYEYTDFA